MKCAEKEELMLTSGMAVNVPNAVKSEMKIMIGARIANSVKYAVKQEVTNMNGRM